ncbi:glycoside hydrolase family protein [Clostridium taeniosporum]|uniref:Lysozyme n=1 Tax=Clostridium taeniosporum TaxID=394958 RepID=A0A1D7XPB2_9CLOT|nr:glycoside hydrolase family protein [Clostridium taeniosporum]AOR25040.1 hypothetical protein BGI42_14940 [Clostridium taeniosporum]
MLDWKEKNGQWYCYKSGRLVKGWVEDENGRWFHLNEHSGKMDTDWTEINSKWYYLYPKRTELDGITHPKGEMATGWIEIDSRWYYLYPKRTEKDGITYPKGEMAAGWIEINSKWYYLYPKRTEKDGNTHYKGEMAIGWIEIDSRWYYLYSKRTEKDGVTYPKGEMATDWTEIDSKWYYLYTKKTEKDGNTHYRGEMAIGWLKSPYSGKWYYLYPKRTEHDGKIHPKGEMATSTTLTINNKAYTFDKNGAMQESTISGNGLVSNKLVEFAAGWEYFSPHAYEDEYHRGDKSCWTIGYGTTYQVKPSAFPNGLDSTCTKPQALVWLKEEMNKVAHEVKSVLHKKGASISQQAFDCLCDIGYNAGTADLLYGKCITLNAVISGDADRITKAIMMWTNANGQFSHGLKGRCKGRVNMCLHGIYDSTH